MVSEGAEVNTSTYPNEYTGMYDTPLGCALALGGGYSESPHSIEIVATLLRAGASLDHCGGRIEYDGNNDVFTAERQLADWSPPEPWSECEALIAGVRAAGGSWTVFERIPLVVLRSLYLKDRATTDDAVMEFVFGLGDNGVFWNVLSFWRARLY
jgi:hypothetical protein